jgi:hypothetical protein
VLPGIGKARCLEFISRFRVSRKYQIDKTYDFLTKTRWLPFILQGGQALYTVTKWVNNGKGYGVILGGVTAAVTDTFWGVVRAPWHGRPKVVGPPPSDPVGQAIRYLSQPPTHLTAGALLSYDDHWILAAADSIAAQIITEQVPFSLLEPRIDEFLTVPVVQYEITNPATRAALLDLGVDPDAPQQPAIAGLSENPTYGETLQKIGAGFDNWVSLVSTEWTDYRSATPMLETIFQAGDDILTWMNHGHPWLSPIFDPEELTLARMFEYQTFPPQPLAPEMLIEVIGRALDLAAAAGRDVPGPRELKEALSEYYPPRSP